jgi:hypothetical protein
MSLPRTLFWAGLGLLVCLWFGSLEVAFSHWGRMPGDGASAATAERETSHEPATRNREVGSFTRISDNGSVDLEITIGPEQSVEVIGDDDAVRKVETSVSGDELVVSQRDSMWSWTSGDVKVKVTVPKLDAVNLQGSGDATIAGLDGGNLELNSYGSGDFKASGKVERLTFTSHGSGDGSLEDLEAADAVIKLHGSGDAHVSASRTLDVETFGSGDVRYSGSPRVSSRITGSGDVSQD